MKPIFAVTMLAFAVVMPCAAADQAPASSRSTLEVLDQRGYFTPDFKAAVHRLVDTKQAVEQAETERKSLVKQLPSAQKEAADTEAKTAALRLELAKYDHPEDNDFVALQAAMKSTASNPAEVDILAQAYVWTYPTSPHASEAQQYLQVVQQKLADQKQADANAEAARVAAHDQLVARGKAHDLNLSEWRALLRGTSQDDLVKLLGTPSSKDAYYWYYNGGWVNEPNGKAKVGMQINFDAGRVITVDEKPARP